MSMKTRLLFALLLLALAYLFLRFGSGDVPVVIAFCLAIVAIMVPIMPRLIRTGNRIDALVKLADKEINNKP